MSKRTPPQTVADYITWLRTDLRISGVDLQPPYYLRVAARILSSFQSSEYWQQFLKELKALESQYRATTGDALLSAASRHGNLLMKPFDSFIEKTFRKNVLKNADFPNAPADGWLDADNWYERVGDIIRTSIVVRYLDAVPFLVSALEEYSRTAEVECVSSFEAREEGYYAAHITVAHRVEIPAQTIGTRQIVAHIEIQITTQLQEAIRTLLHRFYERQRLAPPADPMEWKWDHRSEAFAVNYLGHVLHYLEGNIVQVRDRERGGKS